MKVRDAVETAVAQPIRDLSPLSRGQIGDVYRVTLADGTLLVAKFDDGPEPQLDIAGKMLRKLGYEVSAVGSGEGAVAWISEQTADLVILDMIMEPGIDGCETYRQMLEIRPGQRAIVASGYAENERAREVQALGAGSYVRKPFTMDQLANAVRTELDRGQTRG